MPSGIQFLLFNSYDDAKSYEDIIACLDLFKLMGITVFFEESDSEESLKKLPKLIEHAHACIKQGNYGGYTSREVALKHVAGMEGQFSLYKALLQRGFKVVCVDTQTNSQTRHVQRVVDANMNIAENIVTYLNSHPTSKATGLFGSMHCLLVQEPVLTVAQDMECQGYILNEPSNFFSQYDIELPHTCKDIAAALLTSKVSIIDSALLYTSLNLKWHTSEYRESTHSLIQEQVLLDPPATSVVVQPPGLPDYKYLVNGSCSLPKEKTYERNREYFVEHDVIGDGNCGYTAFGITRDEALRLINTHLHDVRELLQPIVEEQLLDENFMYYLETQEGSPLIAEAFAAYQKASQQGGQMPDKITHTLTEFARDLVVIQAYINYDIRDRKVDDGWAHPRVLQALAHIQGVELYIWQLDESHCLIENLTMR